MFSLSSSVFIVRFFSLKGLAFLVRSLEVKVYDDRGGLVISV